MGRVRRPERDLRVLKVEELLLGGATDAQIIVFCGDPDQKSKAPSWTVKRVTAKRYIAEAYGLIAEAACIDRDTELGRAVLRLHFLFQAAMRIQDFRLAHTVETTRIELLGLRAAAEIKIEGTRTDTRTITTKYDGLPRDRLLEIREQILARLAGNGGDPDGAVGSGAVVDDGGDGRAPH